MKRHWDEQELAEHWSLTNDELENIRSRADHNRIGFAAMLKFFQVAGRFPNDRSEIPRLALEHLAKQLDVSPKALEEYKLSVRTIADFAFSGCTNLTSVIIPKSVTSITGVPFFNCTSLRGVYFEGGAPTTLWGMSVNATVFYVPGTLGWGTTFGGLSTALWQPQAQISDASFGVQTNGFGFTITWASDKAVVIEASPDLAHPTWSPVGTNTLAGGSSYFSDPQRANYPRRFYRLRSQ